MNEVFDLKDSRPLEKNESYEGKIVVISADSFKPEYQERKYQLFLALGGIGCDYVNLGETIFGKDFENSYVQERENVLGVAKEETIQLWEEEYGMSREIFYMTK